MKRKRLFAFGMVALAVSQAVYADGTTLPEVTVTSTTIDDRFTGKRGEPASVHEISGQTVDEKRPENMIEILRSIPGVTADLSSGAVTITFKHGARADCDWNQAHPAGALMDAAGRPYTQSA